MPKPLSGSPNERLASSPCSATNKRDGFSVPFVAPRRDLPGEWTLAIAGVTLPSGHPRPDEDAFFWATDESVPDPGRFTSPLAAAFPVTGLWPLLWEWEEDPANYYWQRPTLDGIDAFSAEEVLRVACESYADCPAAPG